MCASSVRTCPSRTPRTSSTACVPNVSVRLPNSELKVQLKANRIRADADRQVTIIKADATREGERTRGEGDAERNRIFADAFGRDPDFFGFYRSMQAYEQGIKSSDTRMLLTPDGEFFRYFTNPSGNNANGAQPKR